jgi:hypothetical protein
MLRVSATQEKISLKKKEAALKPLFVIKNWRDFLSYKKDEKDLARTNLKPE